MPVNIQNVLVCDAVDESCIQLLKSNGIKVWTKHAAKRKATTATVKAIE